MKIPTICYPRGGGGSWLHNLVWQLENNHWALNDKDLIVFDFLSKSDSMRTSHIYEKQDNLPPRYYDLTNRIVIKFSSPHWFNHYLNESIKVKYHISNLGQKTIVEQFHLLTDNAVYMITDELYHKTWSVPDLEYQLIFTNPQQFIDKFFAMLDQWSIKYTPNRQHFLSSIEHYKSTCPRTHNHLGNFDSLLWLAWIHAWTLIDHCPLSETIPDNASLEDIKKIIEPVSQGILEKTQTMAIL